MTLDFGYAKRVLTTYGLRPLTEQRCEEELIDCDFFTFAIDDGDGTIGVIAWSGSWPFSIDHDKGSFHTIEEAARYAMWLSERENTYNERMEKQLDEAEGL